MTTEVIEAASRVPCSLASPLFVDYLAARVTAALKESLVCFF
jgi:hypothetical protein